MFPKTKEQFIQRIINLRDLAGFLQPGSTPIMLFNDEGRLHSESGPAYRSQTRITWYSDGKKHGMDADVWGSVTYYWKGVLIPELFFLNPEKVSLDDILEHPNAEVRCVGMEIYGYARMTTEGHFKLINSNTDKEMFLYQYQSAKLHESLCILQLKNSTPERDGTHKIYYLCVPPHMNTCTEAVAWTFNKKAQDYNPILET